MRKYIFCTLFPVLFFLSSSSQFSKESEIFLLAKIDSLKKTIPKLNGKAKVDCLNAIVDQYQIMDEDNQMQIDSAGPYARQAYEYAIKIGYERGLGYACLKQSYIKLLWGQNHKDDIKNTEKYADSLNSIQKLIDECMQISKKINDFIMMGSAYASLGWLENLKGNKELQIKYHKEAISYIERQTIQSTNTYKEMNYTNCSECSGQEFRLAELYSGLAYFNSNKSEKNEALKKAVALYKKAEAYPAVSNTYSALISIADANGNTEGAKKLINEAISYYEKTGNNKALGNLFYYLSFTYFRMFNLKASEDASIKSLSYYQKANDKENQMLVITELCKVYEVHGDFENGVEYCKKSIQLAEELNKNKGKGSQNVRSQGQAFFWMGRLYKIAGDYETAMEIIHRGRNFYPDPIDSLSKAFWSAEIGDAYRLLKNYDSALYYLEPFKNTVNHPNNFGKIHLGFLYLELKEYDKALELITPYILDLKKLNRKMVPLANGLMTAANAYLGKNDNKAALQNAREALADIKFMNARVLMIKDYKLLSDIFRRMDNNDSAYYYLNQYTILKDSLLNRQFYFKLTNYKKEAEDERKTSQINLLNKDNQLKEQKLKQQAFVKNSLIIGIILLLLLGVFIFRNLSLKRKNDKLRLQKDLEMQQLASEKKHAELQQQALELEMQALRAQMNPHFIFNCLSSINRFIFKNDNKLASDYLTRFSRLIRMVLMHSSKKLITLEDELEMLRLYLDLERMRFKDAFGYSITTTNIVDAGAIFIPPLLLQPFCENAVWHGLMHKETKGHLNVIICEVITEEEKVLNCVIEDDGIGREKAAEFKSKSAENEKSMGLKITTERLALLNQENNFSTFYQIEDVQNENKEVAGTRVKLKIRFKESMEEAFDHNNITAENLSKKS